MSELSNQNLNDKIDKLEKIIIEIKNTLLSSNQELINQNIKLSNMIYGSNLTNFNFTPEPPPASPIENNNDKFKSLFYKKDNDKQEVYIYGSGTYDNRDKIRKEGGEWSGENKMWIIKVMDPFDEKLNKIIENLNLKVEN